MRVPRTKAALGERAQPFRALDALGTRTGLSRRIDLHLPVACRPERIAWSKSALVDGPLLADERFDAKVSDA